MALKLKDALAQAKTDSHLQGWIPLDTVSLSRCLPTSLRQFRLLVRGVRARCRSHAPQVVDAKTAAVVKANEDSLWWWNLAFGLLQMQMAILVAALSTENVTSFRLPLLTLFTDWTLGYPAVKVEHRGLVPFAEVSAAFSWMSAAAHFVVIVAWESYITGVRIGVNKFRW